MLQLFSERPNLIINTDTDGILSGLLLTEYLGCKISGFCNSADKVWFLGEKPNAEKVVFVDMFVSNPKIACIDQHIVSFNREHHEMIMQNPLKINPNILRGRSFNPDDSYFAKYPFATVHFLIALLEKNGIKINLPNKALGALTGFDFLLRADDTAYNSLKAYKKNADEWWKWMKQFSQNGKMVDSIITALENEKRDVAKVKKEVSEFMKNNFGCQKADGGFTEITDQNGNLHLNFKEYILFLSEIFELKPPNLNNKNTSDTGKSKPETFSAFRF